MEITYEMIADCMKDTATDGKLIQLHTMIQQAMNQYYDNDRMESILGTLHYCDVDTSNMSQLDILRAYAELL
jgi:hypothetical protein